MRDAKEVARDIERVGELLVWAIEMARCYRAGAGYEQDAPAPPAWLEQVADGGGK